MVVKIARSLSLATLVVVLLGCGSSGAPTSASATMNDASLAWCLDRTNHRAVAQAAINLGLKETMASLNVLGVKGDIWLDIEAQGLAHDPFISEAAYGKLWLNQVAAWQTQQPESFNRSCLAAYEGRS